MTLRAWAALALVLLLAAGGLGYYSGHKNLQIDKAIQQSQELKGKVHALTEESQAHKALADQAGQTVEDQDKALSALKAKLAKAQGAIPHPLVASASMGGASSAGAPVDGSVDSLKDQIINTQDQQIGTLKIEVSELRAALDAKDRALITSEQRARGLELALEAQKHASKSQRWLGRIEGVAVGIAIGYAGGKLR